MATQNRSARSKKIIERSKNETNVNHSVMGWAVQNGSKNLAIVQGRVRDDAKKKM